MLNISFLADKIELYDQTVCIASNAEKKSNRDLDLDPTMPDIELV